MSFLAKIKGPAVEFFGFLWTAGAEVLIIKLHPVNALGVAICLLIYATNRDLPGLFAWIKFAKPAWVSFVSMAIATLVVAHIGGWHADIIIAGLATMCVGRLFDYLY